MSIFIQEVLGLLKRNQKKITLDKTKDWFEFGKLYQSSSLNNKSSYTPKMDPFVIKWGDLVCQATEDLTRTLPGQGNFGYIPVYTDPSGFCSWDTLKDSIITQNALNTIINIGGDLEVLGDVQISGGDLTATTSTFNLLNTAPVSVINFGGTTTNIEVGGAATVVNINGTTESTSCTTGALVVDGGVGIAKNLNICGIVFIDNPTQSTDCTTGALVIGGGVGIAKNLNVCEDLTVQGNTYLKGNVTLGDTISNDIILNGQLIDNYGNGPLPNQVLVGQGGGLVAWQNDDIVETLSYGSLWQGNASNVKQELTIGSADQILISDGTTFSWQNNPAAIVGEVCAVNSIPLWTPNSNTLGCSLIYQDGNSSTPATKIFLKGGLASETSQVRTITDVALGYGNYAGGENSAAFNFRSSALGNDSFALGHRTIAGGHGSLAAGYNTGAGNYGFGFFNTTTTSTTLDINILSGTIAVGDFIYANVDTDPTIRYEILTLVGTGTIGLNTITIATPISVNANEAVAIEEAVPNRGDSQGAIALGVNTASKGQGAIAIGTRANTDIKDQIAIGSDITTIKLDGISQNDTQNKVLVIDSNNIVRWREASTIGGGGSGTITADNGLTMGSATNVQLGGTLIQQTNINTDNYRIRLSSNTSMTDSVFVIDAIGGAASSHGIRTNSVGGFAGYFETPSGLGAIYATNSGSTPTVTFNQSNGQAVVKLSRSGNNTGGINPVIDIYNECNAGSTLEGFGASINFNLENDSSFVSYAGQISFDWTIPTATNLSSRFKIETIEQNVASTKLEIIQGQLKLNKYGVNSFAGSAVYSLGVNSGGYVVEIPIAGGGSVTSVSGVGSVSGLTLTGTVTSSGDLTLGGTLSLTSSDVTNGLGYIPYNATNPDGYTSFAEPGIYSGGGTPTLAAGVTAQEVRDLIGAGTPIVDTDFVKNTADTYTSTSKVTQIVTLTQAEYDLIPSPLNSTLYVIL